MIIIKTKEEIEIMYRGGKILGRILKELARNAKPGITTGFLEELACDLIKKAGGRPSFKGYKTMFETKPYPTALCTSINNEIVHAPALPSRTLNEGDILSIDVGMEYPYSPEQRGYYTDTALTIPIGKIKPEADKLIKVTKRSLQLALKIVKPGATLNDIGKAIQDYVEGNGFSIVRDLVGHGVGTAVHEDPQVPNYQIRDQYIDNIVLKPGMTIAIEPMVNIGRPEIKSMPDGTIITADGSLSAHFEHTIAVVKDGSIILTE